MKYKLVLFDIDDTLFDLQKSQEGAFRETVAHFSIPYHLPILYNQFRKVNRELWEKVARQEMSPLELREKRFHLAFEPFGITGNFSAMGEYYSERLANGAELRAGAEAICEYIHGRSIPIGLVSNGFAKVQKSRVESSALAPYISFIIASDEVSHAKPAPDIFNAALVRAGEVPPAHALMVGDNLETDIAGANGVGIHSCLYNPSQVPIDEEFLGALQKPTYIVSDLFEVRKILI
jgi:2-haloacid dehalogenase